MPTSSFDEKVVVDINTPEGAAMLADLESDVPVTHNKVSYSAPCIICGEAVETDVFHNVVVCEKCRAAVLSVRDCFSKDTVITDSDKAKEIAEALKRPRDKSVKACHPEKLPENAKSVWFGNGRGHKRVYISPEKAEKFVDAMIDAEKNLPKVNESTIPEVSKEDIRKTFTHKQITEAVNNLLAEAKRVAKGEGEYYTYDDIFGNEDKE